MSPAERERIAEHARRLVATAPELGEARRQQLAAVLRSPAPVRRC